MMSVTTHTHKQPISVRHGTVTFDDVALVELTAGVIRVDDQMVGGVCPGGIAMINAECALRGDDHPARIGLVEFI
jgi:hypothetical protein